jgi:Ca2+-dependent lipid-binding protein
LYSESGVIVFHVISGQLQKKARLEVLLDDGYWPCLSTIKARSTHAQWGYVGEGFVKEVDFGRVWLRLNESDDKDDIISEWRGDVKEFLQNTLVCLVHVGSHYESSCDVKPLEWTQDVRNEGQGRQDQRHCQY